MITLMYQKKQYKPSRISCHSRFLFVLLGIQTTDGGKTPRSSLALLSFGLSNSLSYTLHEEEKEEEKQIEGDDTMFKY